MKLLTKSHRILLSEDDKLLLMSLKKYKIKPNHFIRIAVKEKIERDLPIILKEEEKRKSKEYCPF